MVGYHTRKMFKIDIPNKLSQILHLFFVLRIWQSDEGNSWKILIKIFHLIMHGTFGISLLSGAYLSDDRNESIFLTTAAMAAAVLNIKLGFIIWLQEETNTLLQYFGNHSITDQSEFYRMNKKINNLVNFVSVFLSMTFFGSVPILVVYSPIFMDTKKLSVSIGFPFDWRNNDFAYWTAFLYVLYCYLFCILCVLITAIIWYLMMNCSIKYDLLGYQFKQLGTTSSSEEQKDSISNLIHLIKLHQRLKL